VLLSRLAAAGIPRVEVISASEMAKRYQLQLVQRDTDACAVAVIAAWWKKLRCPSGDLKTHDKLVINLATSSAVIDLAPPLVDSVPPEDFKDLDKMGSPTIHLSPSSIDPADKVVWEPMKALNQLDRATGDFIMEDNSDDTPPSLNSPRSTGSRTPPPLCSPLSFRQLRTVHQKTNNDERQGNDAMNFQGGGADADGVMGGGVGLGIQDDHCELTPFPYAGDLLNASFSLELGVSPVHSSVVDSVVGVYAEDSVMHVGDTDGTIAMVDTDDRATDAVMMMDLGGLEDVVEGFFAPALAPSPVSLDQVTLGMEVQVPEEEAMVGPGVVAFLAAQEKAKLTAWQQAFSRIPHKSFLQSVQGELTIGVTCMEATYPSCTMSCSKAFRASLTAYDLTMEVVKDTYFKPYILAAGNFPGCLEIPAKKWGDTENAERGRLVLVMRARYRSARLTLHQRGWTDAS